MDSRSSRSTTVDPIPTAHLPALGGKYLALLVLFLMNLLNYVDRYSFFAAGTHIQNELQINDFRYGVLGASFMIVYTIVSPAMGWMGDRFNRKLLIAGGVALWSVATVGTAFSSNYAEMFCWRALLGVGEASYGVIAPALLADLFPVRERGRAMGVYYLALPVGTALGYILGGKIADDLGWRAVFFVVGLPGLLAAALGLVMNDPGRGASEEGAPAAKASRPTLHDYLDLFRTRTFLYNTAGMAAVTFATGAYAAWGSTFYQRVHSLTATEAGDRIGRLLVFAGILGIILGMFIPDLLRRLTKRAYLLVAAVAVLGAIPLGAFGILEPDYNFSLRFLFVASILLSMVLGPCNTVTANVVPPNRRATAYASFIFLIHLFGDISSPILLGWVSDLFGAPAVADSPLGRFFASIGAAPVDQTNLTVAMLSVAPVLFLGFVFFAIGSRYLPGDQEKARGDGPDEPGAVSRLAH
jgi:MFS transporter, Spinster family, sphingosine-1-phosphate transporter